MKFPSRSPSPTPLDTAPIDMNDLKNIDFKEATFLEDDVQIEALAKSKTEEEVKQEKADAEARGRTHVLAMLDDLPEADVKPPETVLFVCKLNAVTQSDDLEIIFSRFGKVVTCEVIRDWKSGDSLQYAFVEFETEDACIMAYSKMDGVLIDERRIKVDFSNSVAKLWNKHHRKKLQEKAQEIIENEKRTNEKKYNVLHGHSGAKEVKRRGEEGASSGGSPQTARNSSESAGSRDVHKHRHRDRRDHKSSRRSHDYRGRERDDERRSKRHTRHRDDDYSRDHRRGEGRDRHRQRSRSRSP